MSVMKNFPCSILALKSPKHLVGKVISNKKQREKEEGEKGEYKGNGWGNVKSWREEMRSEATKSCREILIGTTAVLYS